MKTIVTYFEETALAYPEKTAVADETSRLSYEGMEEAVRRAATTIASMGLFRRPIALLIHRTCRLPEAMLSVLYSGNYYVVLDCDSPAERLKKIMDTLHPARLMCEESLLELGKSIYQDILLFEDALSIKEEPELLKEVRAKVLPTDPAYVLFTSGSTGIPKGAVLTHENVIAYIKWFTECFGIDSHTVFGAQTSLHFSMSVSDFYGTIFTGATYHMIPKKYFTFPAKLISFLNERKINTLYWVPSAMGLVAKYDLFKYCMPEHVQKVLFAGEAMPVKYLNYWKKYLPDVIYANLFGPTETTDICCYYVVNREFSQDESLPIGKACTNCRLFVLDENGQEVQGRKVGELYVSGPFVARGYYGNPEKTQEAFVQNPLEPAFPDVVYRTGDLVYRNEYGELEYAGRKDSQIKHAGYRIELSEIEHALNTVSGVELTVCLYEKEQDCLLLAYESAEELDEKLNQAAHQLLPEYMYPSVYRRFDHFPRNENGKIDRKEIMCQMMQ